MCKRSHVDGDECVCVRGVMWMEMSVCVCVREVMGMEMSVCVCVCVGVYVCVLQCMHIWMDVLYWLDYHYPVNDPTCLTKPDYLC